MLAELALSQEPPQSCGLGGNRVSWWLKWMLLSYAQQSAALVKIFQMHPVCTERVFTPSRENWLLMLHEKTVIVNNEHFENNANEWVIQVQRALRTGRKTGFGPVSRCGGVCSPQCLGP